MKTINYDAVFNGLNQFSNLTDDQKASIAKRLNAMLNNKPGDFETFTSSMFEFSPTSPKHGNHAISKAQSSQIWQTLNTLNVIDDYGVLLLKPNSDELTAAINGVPSLSTGQKERVLAILNQHPELSYRSYLADFGEVSDPESELPRAGIYFADGAPVKKSEGLTKEQLNYIRIMAVLEWNVMLISQKTVHKTRIKSAEKLKKEKKADKLENEKHMAELEARYREQAKKSSRKK